MSRQDRERVRCGKCELVQFRTETGRCRRCEHELLRGSVESTTVIIVRSDEMSIPHTILPMREVMRQAVVDAMTLIGATTKVAEALGITAARVKQLLRESGDETDYRKGKKQRKAKR